MARWWRTQWSVLGTQAGVLLANPIPPDAALEASEVEAAVVAAALAVAIISSAP